MQTSVAALLFFAGVAGGAINAVAGGATLITFPAMLAAGLPPVVANASNAVAISPGHLLAAIADNDKFPVIDRWLCGAVAVATLGGPIGALLLIALPERLFVLPVPALIGFSTALFAFAPAIQARSVRRASETKSSTLAELGSLAGVAVYGGFFGAGLGIMLTALLSIVVPDDIRRVKVLKNLLATAVSLAAIIIFIVQGAVWWTQTITMLSGAVVGGYAGGHMVRVLPATMIRRIVIGAGSVMTVVYAVKYWF